MDVRSIASRGMMCRAGDGGQWGGRGYFTLSGADCITGSDACCIVDGEASGYFDKTTHGKRRARAMKITVTIDRDEDGVWVAECPSIPGCVSQGDTKDEALANIREAIELCIEVRAESGMPLTVETRQVEVAP